MDQYIVKYFIVLLKQQNAGIADMSLACLGLRFKL